MLYLITGGAGFIGSHLAWTLAEQGEQVRVLDNFDTGSTETVRMLQSAFGRRVEAMEGDIRRADTCAEAMRGVDYVLHHAAIASVTRSIDDPDACAAVNIGGTVGILRAAKAAKSVRRVVFASSSAVYGDSRSRVKRESDPPRPMSPYASSKLAGEYFCADYARLLGLETVSLRYFNVYGERQNPAGSYAAVVPNFVVSALRGERPVIYGDGRQIRDFVYVGDVVRANMAACAARQIAPVGSPINIAGGKGYTVRGLLIELGEVVGRKLPARHAPERPGDIRRSVAGIDPARESLGFAPLVDLREGLARMVRHYAEQPRK